MRQITNNQKYTALMALTCVIFGTIGVLYHYMDINGFAFVAMVRGFGGSFILFLFMLITKKKLHKEAIRKNWWRILLGGFLLAVNWTFLYMNYRINGTATSALINYLAPMIVIIVSPFLFQEKVKAIQWPFIGVTFIGVILLSGLFGGANETGNVALLIIYGIITALSFAGQILINKTVKGVGSDEMGAIELAVCGLSLIPIVCFTERDTVRQIDWTMLRIILLSVAAIVQTGIVYALYFACLSNLKARTLSLMSYIDPCITVMLGIFVLKEEISTIKIIGVILICAGIFFTEHLAKTKIKIGRSESLSKP